MTQITSHLWIGNIRCLSPDVTVGHTEGLFSTAVETHGITGLSGKVSDDQRLIVHVQGETLVLCLGLGTGVCLCVLGGEEGGPGFPLTLLLR